MRITLLFVLLAAVVTAQSAPQVVLGSGKRIAGTGIRADEKGIIYLTTPEGVLTFPAGSTVVVDEPAAYRAAIANMQRQRYEDAVKELRTVVEEFKFLVWDKKAERLLASALAGNHDYQGAVMAYERVFNDSPEVRDDPGTWRDYLEALLSSGQYEKLKPILDKTVMKGAREVAARAQMMRGKMNMDAGKSEAALFDFMRTAELFGDVSEYQAEAYFRAGECLEKLGDQRARDYFLKVKKDFADSPFAVKAGSK